MNIYITLEGQPDARGERATFSAHGDLRLLRALVAALAPTPPPPSAAPASPAAGGGAPTDAKEVGRDG